MGSLKGSQIELHNDLRPFSKLFMLKRLVLKDLDIRAYLDVGCGIGATVAAARKMWPAARACGIDVSMDAVKHARETVPGADFICMAIDTETEFPDRFDLITAFEFYPFTRTSDVQFQSGILRTLSRGLAPGGTLLIRHYGGNSESMDVNIGVLTGRKSTPPHYSARASSSQNLLVAEASRPFEASFLSRE